MRRTLLLRVAVIAAALLVTACTYEPPPLVDLERPSGAVFDLGSPLVLKFSDPINPDTLAIRVWAGDRDQENELKRDQGPKLDTCRPKSSPCGKNTITVAKDRLSATIVLDPKEVGKVDVPLVLEVEAGLKNAAGRALTIPVWFDFQFAPALPTVTTDADAGVDAVATRPMEFESGIYVILAQIDKPLPAVLTLLADFRVLPDGRGSFAGAEGDEIGDAPKNTDDPTKLKIDTTKEGYTVFMSSRFDWDGDNRIMTGNPVNVKVYVGPLTVYLNQVRLKGFVLDDGAGHNSIEGTLSFEGVTLATGDQSVDYPANSTTFTAKWVPPAHVPKGTPDLCTDLCGAVKDGICEPPSDFPDQDFCQ